MTQHLRAVWAYRHFWMSLVQMDLRSRYRRSVLGIGWSMLHPILMSGVFCLVFSQILNISSHEWERFGYPAAWRGYAAYLLCSMAVWDFIRNSLTLGCMALIRNEAYIRQCPLPYGIYPLRAVMGTFIHYLISLVVILVLVSLLKGSATPLGKLWAVLPVVALLVAFCWAIATIAAFATVYFHDTTHLVEVGSQLFFFLTPIMYTREAAPQLAPFFDLNPVVVFLDLTRLPLVFDTVPPAALYGQAAVLTAVAVGLAFGTIGWLQKKVIFHL